MNKRWLNNLKVLNELNPAPILALIVGVLWTAPLPVLAQTNVSRPATGRYLLIVETSHSMKSRSDGVIKTAANLLFNGMNGQIRAGDSIGVWTYNQELYSGRLPLQRWSSLVQRDVSSAILNFLKEQKYEKQPAFSSARQALEKVVKDSEFITVVLVSSGDEPMTGSPFDDKINELYKTWHDEQQKSRMPFVTVLRAKRGTIIGYSVTPSPWQVEMPAWPPEPLVKTPEQSAPPPKVQPPTVPPLIVSGKKSKPPESANASQVVTPTNESAPTATVASSPEPVPIVTTIKTPPTNSAGVALPEPKAERPATPAPNVKTEPILTNATPKPENASLGPASNSNSIPAENAQNPTAPAQEVSTAVAASNTGIFSNKIIWLAGLAVLGIACAILIVISRRPHSDNISLITRSLERERK